MVTPILSTLFRESFYRNSGPLGCSSRLASFLYFPFYSVFKDGIPQITPQSHSFVFNDVHSVILYLNEFFFFYWVLGGVVTITLFISGNS